jgi:hypothetical protein
MGKKEEIVNEIHRLINEQMQRLRGKLSPTEATRFADRSRRIDELLDRLSKGDLGE